MKELHLTRKDFRIDWFAGTGGGGQYRNKHQNCCRITHVATGLVATGQSNRERPANQKEAFKALAAKVLAYYADEKEDGRNHTADIVRTYHFERDSVYDTENSSTIDEALYKGNLDKFIKTNLISTTTRQKSGRV